MMKTFMLTLMSFAARIVFATGIAACHYGVLNAAEETNDLRLLEELQRTNYRAELAVVDGKATVIRVTAASLTEQLLVRLRTFRELRSLEVGGIVREDQTRQLPHLSSLRNLRELTLTGRAIDDRALSFLSSLTNLETLRLINVDVEGDGLGYLAHLKSLKYLDLVTHKKVRLAAFQSIAGIQALESIRLIGNCERGAWSVLKTHSRIHSVSIGGDYVNDKLAELKDIPTITAITIATAHIDAATVGHLTGMKRLESLKLECCSVAPNAVQDLANLRLQSFACVGLNTETIKHLLNGLRGYGKGDIELFR
jgi:hypothetical protein